MILSTHTNQRADLAVRGISWLSLAENQVQSRKRW